MVNPTQLPDKEFAAWMERLVEARKNRQEIDQDPITSSGNLSYKEEVKVKRFSGNRS